MATTRETTFDKGPVVNAPLGWQSYQDYLGEWAAGSRSVSQRCAHETGRRVNDIPSDAETPAFQNGRWPSRDLDLQYAFGGSGTSGIM